MNTKLLFCGIALAGSLSLASCDNDTANSTSNEFKAIQLTDETRAQVDGENAFGLKLFNTILSESKQNKVVSPLSLYMALAMVANCEEKAPEQLLNILNCDSEGKSLKDINDLCSTLLSSLPKADTQTTCTFANSLWTEDTSIVSQTALSLLQKDYGAEIFAQSPAGTSGKSAINKWVNTATKGLIPEVLKSTINGKIAWINATYFNGKWRLPFDKASTKEANFHNYDGSVASTSFMNNVEEYSYFENADLQLVSLPYGNRHFVMDVILPAEGKNVADVMAAFDNKAYNEMISRSTQTEVTLSFPKFDLTNDTDLLAILNKMGYQPSDNAAILISSIIQSANIKVDEKGTEAAAATVVEGFTSSGWPDKVTMTCDRPFAFIIREVSTGTYLYMGQVAAY